jgi:hypothetical protein
MTPDAAPSGVLLIDKPLGMTSFDVIRQLRHTTGQRKLGHAGTLDPMATGLLLILVNQATRLSDHIMHAPKRYDAQLTFGVATDSEDKEGQPTSTAPWEHITLAAIEAALPSLTGDVMQRPPRVLRPARARRARLRPRPPRPSPRDGGAPSAHRGDLRPRVRAPCAALLRALRPRNLHPQHRQGLGRGRRQRRPPLRPAPHPHRALRPLRRAAPLRPRL